MVTIIQRTYVVRLPWAEGMRRSLQKGKEIGKGLVALPISSSDKAISHFLFPVPYLSLAYSSAIVTQGGHSLGREPACVADGWGISHPAHC